MMARLAAPGKADPADVQKKLLNQCGERIRHYHPSLCHCYFRAIQPAAHLVVRGCVAGQGHWLSGRHPGCPAAACWHLVRRGPHGGSLHHEQCCPPLVYAATSHPLGLTGTCWAGTEGMPVGCPPCMAKKHGGSCPVLHCPAVSKAPNVVSFLPEFQGSCPLRPDAASSRLHQGTHVQEFHRLGHVTGLRCLRHGVGNWHPAMADEGSGPALGGRYCPVGCMARMQSFLPQAAFPSFLPACTWHIPIPDHQLLAKIVASVNSGARLYGIACMLARCGLRRMQTALLGPLRKITQAYNVWRS